MKRILSVALLMFVMLVSMVPAAKAQTASLSIYVANPSGPTGSSVPVYPVDPAAFNTTGISYSATTTACIVTALAGRKQITFDLASGAGCIWVNVGSTTPVVSRYISVEAGAAGAVSRTFTIDDSIPVSYISSTAVNVSVLQEGFKNQAKR